MGSFAINIPYSIHDKAFNHVVKLMEKGIAAVVFDLMTVVNAARGEPLRITARVQPISPNK